MNPLSPELATRAAALSACGFTVVEAEAWSFVAVRSKWHWDLCMHLTVVVRVRRVQHLTGADARVGRQTVDALGAKWDPSRLPRGMQHARAVADVVLVDTADDAARALATGPVGKGYGMSMHTAIVPIGGGSMLLAKPLWGAAFWPKIEHAVQVAAGGQTFAEPTPTLGIVLAVLLFYPSLAVLGLFCCGIPIIVGVVLVMTEKPLVPAIAGAPPALTGGSTST